VREGGVSKRKLPANFRPEDAPLFEHELERVIPPTLLVELRGVSATSEGVLYKGARILPESYSSPVVLRQFLDRRASVVKFFAANLARRRRKIRARCAWVTDDWSYGYFHWLSDALPRLFTIRERLGELVLLLPQRYEGLEFVRSSLEIFSARRVEYVREGEVCFCERLLMPTHAAPSGNYNEGLMREMRRFILDSFAVGDEPRGRIYLSRSRAPKRKVVNEDEVVSVLGEFGFRVEHFEDYAFERQVEIAAGASHFVSNHGAGLTNMLFMRPGGSVLELRRRGEQERNWFFNLANSSGLEYFYQSCAPADAVEDPHTANVLVDPRALGENLSLMLGQDAESR
jgi:hypothetical protein